MFPASELARALFGKLVRDTLGVDIDVESREFGCSLSASARSGHTPQSPARRHPVR
ncbi:hypothetical protein HN371_19695 [Candidatus Poribacteria bacterium]|jgi:hypothetical protein|nr:hypothetical protein [Candidatus Poribacteria bacterium]MBT5531775.1 hypothetical protein [Candidatus Poribacteria bacterium]MBT5713830.1 hypothetical protein [Candidatus Poribacteria bacterium]MBT7804515.1 hypothetical protein [Candidatus Poribacteria bacterium]